MLQLRFRHGMRTSAFFERSIAMATARALYPILGVAMLLTSASPLNARQGTNAASEQGATLWVYPVIKHFGGVHPRPDLPTGLAPGSDYKVIADVVRGDPDRTRALPALQRLARLVNLFAYAGVPAAHVHVAAVIEGEVASAILTNAAYRTRFNLDNPNLELLHELRKSGVELMVCAQTLAESRVPDGDISPDVAVSLSALTDFAAYEARGYSYLQL
jgi:intracellular sulfur oxidation DsrE/DsrF family protein